MRDTKENITNTPKLLTIMNGDEKYNIIINKINKINDSEIQDILKDSIEIGAYNLIEFYELIDYINIFLKIKQKKYYKCKYFIDYFFDIKNKILNTYHSIIYSIPPPLYNEKKLHINLNKLEKILNKYIVDYSYKCNELSLKNVNVDSYLTQDLIHSEKPYNMADNKYYFYL